jgi:Protein of unknown function (DUF4231)
VDRRTSFVGPSIVSAVSDDEPAGPRRRRQPPALLNRFPKLRLRAESTPVVPHGVRSSYPGLTADLAVLDDVVGPSFAAADRAALIEQNRHRLFQVLILFGSAVLSGSAALQGVFPDQRWPGILSAVLGLLLATVGQTAGELGTLTEFQSSRMKAERLRAMHFEYLARAGRFGGPDRDTALRRAVIAIEAGKEPS